MVDYITAIASTIAALSIFILWLQLRSDHERSRREKAVYLMEFYNNLNRPNTASMFWFVEQLSNEQCESLWRREEFYIDERFEDDVKDCLFEYSEDVELVVENNSIKLKRNQVAIIRNLVVSYLNQLETVASAWRNNIADKEILEEEFRDIFLPKPNKSVLDTLRSVTGIYPSIHLIVDELKQKHAPKHGKGRIA